MAKKEESKRLSQNHEEILALVGFVLFVLIFPSVFTYNPLDHHYNTTNPNTPTLNAWGWIGMWIAYLFFFFFGVTSFFVPFLFLIPSVILGFRLFKFEFSRQTSVVLKVLMGGVVLVSMACLLQLLFPSLGQKAYVIPSSGGYLGRELVNHVFAPTFGFWGSSFLLLLIYVIAIVVLFGVDPISSMVHPAREFLRRFTGEVDEGDVKMLEEKISTVSDPKVRARLIRELNQKLEKVGERIRRNSGKELEGVGEGDALGKSTPGQPTVEPKIIDTSMPSIPEPEKGPVRSKGREKIRPMQEESDEAEAEPESIPPRGIPEKVQGRLSRENPTLAPKPEISYENYKLPGMEHLRTQDPASFVAANRDELLAQSQTIVGLFKQFEIIVHPDEITKGPTITRFEFVPNAGVKLDKIVALEKNIAMALRAERINILAPVPGKNTFGIEVANSKKVVILMSEILQNDEWKKSPGRIPVALGKDVYGKVIVGDLTAMPHLLVGGTTGSGKSVCMNSLIVSMLYTFSPADLRIIMIDPKKVEMQVYNRLPHLAVPVVTDPKKVIMALKWVIFEMEKRYEIFAKCGVRNISTFNSRPKPAQPLIEALDLAEELEKEEDTREIPPAPEEDGPAQQTLPIVVPRDSDLIIPDRMPYIVVIIDELADLMLTAPADVESCIARITQMARAAGIHMIVATQTPRADVVTGVIKANIPTRISFQVASKLDSRVILDQNGAEKLLGKGDMLYVPPGSSNPVRAQGVFLSDEEVLAVVDWCAGQAAPAYESEIHTKLSKPASEGDNEITEEDKTLCLKSLEIVRQEKRASTSLLQRRLRLGYTRAARIMDIFEDYGLVGAKEGSNDREILVDLGDPQVYSGIERLFS
ncbi:MAG: DNA translocase FtsK [Verrucomicrobiae bacterium]|nr:DNA translocase FtsK [Verrucomicrobiae bacterium]